MADWFSQKQDWATKLIKKYYSPLCLSCLIKWEASKVMSILGIGSLPLILLQGKCKKGATIFWDMIFIKIPKRLTWLGSLNDIDVGIPFYPVYIAGQINFWTLCLSSIQVGVWFLCTFNVLSSLNQNPANPTLTRWARQTKPKSHLRATF